MDSSSANTPSATPPTTLGRDTPTRMVSPESAGAPGLPEPGATPYQILNEIGHGGMSTVYLAKDPKLGRFVAIKRLRPSFLADATMRDRFSLEAQLIASLNHIYIVKLYDFDVRRPEPQIVMEYVAGPGKAPAPDWPPPSLNLEQKLELNGAPLTLRASVVLIRKLCSAIEYAHRRGVIHRDLKPSNILLDEHGEPRIVDFGIARHTALDEVRLTLAGTRMLSLGYAAPEQEAQPADADERADLYSLGGILYFCLTGENPRFFRDSRVPESIRPILLKAMEQDPKQRWATVRDFADVLTQTAGDFLSPLTDPGMWRCKWCGALNPVANRYCTQCNWDGMERCPECAGETRVGVRFCGQCSTDIKAFEDMRALLNRLREFRRQKDFGRIKDAVDGGARFQPRGPHGQELAQEIRDLDETASWALKRKDELTQAIATSLDQQNYEAVRERLNEYGVLDEGPEFRELRNELPWRIAERTIIALRAELDQTRQWMNDKQPGAAATRLAEIENRILSLHELEARFPTLKGALTPASDPSAHPPRTHARAVAGLLEDVARLKSDLARGRQRLEHQMDAALMAFKSQDYEACLRLCEAIKAVSTEASATGELEKKVAGQLKQIDRLLNRGRDALRQRNLDVAERAAQDILTRFKHDAPAALDLLAAVRTRRHRRSLITALIALLAAWVAYVFSIGPVFHLALNQPAPSVSTRETLRTLYQPVYWLHARTPLGNSLERYASRWEPGIFDER